MIQETREIKFKLWDTVTKTMNHADKIEWLISGQPIRAQSFDGLNTYNFSMGYNQETPFILLQYTGLKDKNNKDIYEGDIVHYAEKKRICSHCADKEITSDLTYLSTKFCPNCGKEVTSEDFISIRKVEFTKGGFTYCSEPKDGYYQTWATYIAEIYIAWVEVIGNIYENSELLKTKP